MNTLNKVISLHRWVTLADLTFSDAFRRAVRGKHQYIRGLPRANTNSICAAIMFDASSFLNIKNSRSLSSSAIPEKQNVISEKSGFTTELSYEKALCCLKSLLSNTAFLQSSIEFRQLKNLDNTLKYLFRSGLTLEDIGRTPIIHITGSKGKGSTCAFTESILRSYGIRTGFFSSPHLICVTERFRINGKPICKDDFAESFWKVYERLDQNKENEDDMPPYFQFLTVLCFHIFLKHNVEVGIIEVGIGGEYDCTNIVRNVKTVGITSLSLEHAQILGNTLEKIAWQKAGIIKPKSHVFVTPQPSECIEVIKKRANEKNAKIFIAPDFSNYNWCRIPNLNGYTKISQLNASLAIQLAYDWLRNYKMERLNGFAEKINCSNGIILEAQEKIINGLETCFWPGRNQIINFHNMTIHLDGAHTNESLNICLEWFLESTKNSKNKKCLIFNVTGDRDSKKFLQILHKHRSIFSEVIFVTNFPFDESLKSNVFIDTNLKSKDFIESMEKVTFHANLWNSMELNVNKNVIASQVNSNSCNSKTFGYILEAIEYIHKNSDKSNVDILVTGSLYLVGGTILALEEYDKRL